MGESPGSLHQFGFSVLTDAEFRAYVKASDAGPVLTGAETPDVFESDCLRQ